MSEMLGYWREPNPLLYQGEKLTWLKPNRTGLQNWVCLKGTTRVAIIKRQTAHVGTACTALIDGWVWDMTKVENAFDLKESVARGFESVPAAKRAIAAAIALHPPATTTAKTKRAQR